MGNFPKHGIWDIEDLKQEGRAAGLEHYHKHKSFIDGDTDLNDFFGSVIFFAMRRFIADQQGLLTRTTDWNTFANNRDSIKEERSNSIVTHYNSVSDPSGIQPRENLEIEDLMNQLCQNDKERQLLELQMNNPRIKDREVVEKLELGPSISGGYKQLRKMREILKKRAISHGFTDKNSNDYTNSV
jgi:hypothetical protein